MITGERRYVMFVAPCPCCGLPVDWLAVTSGALQGDQLVTHEIRNHACAV